MIISKEFEWYHDSYLVEICLNIYGINDVEIDYYTVTDRDGKDITDILFPHMEDEIISWVSNYNYGEC